MVAIKYPAPGCVVEFLEDNSPQIAFVLEESGGKLRLLLPSRRETRLAANRVLPWIGPACPAGLGREEAISLLESHKKTRQERFGAIAPLELWELAHGEISEASASWFAELIESEPDIDTIAACGRALLACKTHFRFQPPDFLVYDAELVEKRLAEQKIRAEREALLQGGAAFIQLLWDLACKRKNFAAECVRDSSLAAKLPSQPVADRIEKLLFERVSNPESQEDENLWRLLAKGLPELPHIPFQLLAAWGKLPIHYNFWLDRADYEAGDDWWREYAADVAMLKAIGTCENDAAAMKPEDCPLPFISIDSASTRDIDDAFHIEKTPDGMRLTIALACPALAWPFGSGLDKKIMGRGTSIYLPEGNLHMLPEALGIDAYSLFAGHTRPALCIALDLTEDCELVACHPFLARVKLAANLNFHDTQHTIDALATGAPPPATPAAPFAGQLALANAFALKREKARIANGAIVMRKPEPYIRLLGEGDDTQVELYLEEPIEDSQRLVSEMMVLASGAIADWADSHQIALIHRTQNLTPPPEYAGVWSKAEDLAKIMHSLSASLLEIKAAPHAALAMRRYAPITSPLRRYVDLLNEGQICHFLTTGAPAWQAGELGEILDHLLPALEAAGHVQRYRSRYWKLLYFRQRGDHVWWDGVITEGNDSFVTVALPDQGIFVRARRPMFDGRASPGEAVRVRLGKVNPLYNDIHIIEVMPAT